MKARKLLVLGLALACIATITITATLAYFTDTEAVKNTFTVGHVDITLDETPVATSGEAIEGADCVTENEYKLYPGKEYDKDPHIHIASDSEDCWVYVKVENGLDGIEKAHGKDGYVSIHEQMVANGWSFIDADNYIYVYERVVKADEEIPTFTGFEIAEGVTGAQLAAYEGKTIVVTAYAIQAEGFDKGDGTDAWEAVGGIDGFIAWKEPTTETTPDDESGSEG